MEENLRKKGGCEAHRSQIKGFSFMNHIYTYLDLGLFPQGCQPRSCKLSGETEKKG